MKLNVLAPIWSLLESLRGDGEDFKASDSEIREFIKSSNIDYSTANRLAGTWRWLGAPQLPITVYITPPAAGSKVERDYARKTRKAIKQINSKLKGLLVLEAVTTLPASGNHIIVSYGTSHVPKGSTNYANYCSNVAVGQYVGGQILPNSANGIGSSPVYVNLGNGHCDVTQDVVTHEFGHALGLSYHFTGFDGSGLAISTAYWDVLATLYANPPATAAASLTIRRARK